VKLNKEKIIQALQKNISKTFMTIPIVIAMLLNRVFKAQISSKYRYIVNFVVQSIFKREGLD